jgi:hypothetical protein
MDPKKVADKLDWPTSPNIKAIRGFLGLTGYYCKFIQYYGIIARSLTQLLKKHAFLWGPEADLTFTQLKTAMTQARY